MGWDEDAECDELAAVDNADELCRRLLAPAAGRGSRTRHREAAALLGRVLGTCEPGDGFVALLLCTCRRWDRATGRLIAAIEAGGLLSDGELDELAQAFLADEVVIVYPVAWVSPQWLETEVSAPTGSRLVMSEDTPVTARRRIRPPLRRWAARRALGARPAQLDELLDTAARLDPHGRAAVILGLLDAAAVLGAGERRRLVGIGLETGMARVRRAALELMGELDGAEAALRRARSDRDANVRAWRPTSREPALSLL